MLQGMAEWEGVAVPPELHNLPVQIALWNQLAGQLGHNIRWDWMILDKCFLKMNITQKCLGEQC